MAHHFRVSEFLQTLTPELKAEYDTLVRDARTTVDSAHAWLADHGYDGSRHSTANHKKRNFDDVLKDVRIRSEMAAAIGNVIREQGEGTIRKAALARFEQRLLDLVEDDEINIDDAAKIALTFQRVGLAAFRNQTAAERFSKIMAQEAARGADRTITPERIDDARKRIFGC